MLQICPKKRPTCDQILSHEFFTDLEPNFVLSVDGVSKPKEVATIVDIDGDGEDSVKLGKRPAEVVIDVEQSENKR